MCLGTKYLSSAHLQTEDGIKLRGLPEQHIDTKQNKNIPKQDSETVS